MYTAVSKLKKWRCHGMQDICATKLQMETYPGLSSSAFPSIRDPSPSSESEEILSQSTRVCDRTRDSSVFILRGVERGEKKGNAKRLQLEFPQQLFVPDRVGTAL